MVIGTVADQVMHVFSEAIVDAAGAFEDPDGDPLSYAAVSSSPEVVDARTMGASVSLTAVGIGTATVRVTATDPGGLSASQSFAVTVEKANGIPAFIDDPILPGVTPVRAVHFTQLRARIDGLRVSNGLGRSAWTDPVLRAGVTPVQLVHLLKMRASLAEAYAAAGRAAPRWTDAVPADGSTPIRAVQLTELRAAVVVLE